jgi:DNA replication protein DnaC
VLLLGPPGVGKTHRAVALGRQAIVAGYIVLFVPATTLVAQIAKAHQDGRLEERLFHYAKPTSSVTCRSSRTRRICSSSW